MKRWKESAVSAGQQMAMFQKPIVIIKDFIRSYVRTVRGMWCLSQNRLATVRTTLSCAERFFGSFEEATGSKIVQDDHAEIYSVCKSYSKESQCPNWLKITAEGEIEGTKKQKFNFTRNDFTDLVSSMWICDSPVFLHGFSKCLSYSHYRCFYSWKQGLVLSFQMQNTGVRGASDIRWDDQAWIPLSMSILLLTIHSISSWCCSVVRTKTNLGR